MDLVTAYSNMTERPHENGGDRLQRCSPVVELTSAQDKDQ